ncbi:MAG: aldehyde dehydrogenase family protein [Novosphingobium sp.]|nr:aldehyde dehydrogenase family protein [Novosphingobium sp.]
MTNETHDPSSLLSALCAMKAEHARSRPVPADIRMDRLRRIEALIRKHQHAFVDAAMADFNPKHPVQTRSELAATLGSAKHAAKHVRTWMKPRRVAVPLPLRLTGARAEVYPQPLGVVGVVSPWNFPFNLSLAPLAGIFAAGNVAMVKPSEIGPACSEALAAALGEYYDPGEVRSVLGGPDVGRAFTALPFDHLLFTGSPAIGRHVMRAAADNLVPVTLELGGKCPVIVDRDADIAVAAKRVALGKMQNSGQLCLSPDTLFVPEERVDQFIGAMRTVFEASFAAIADNPDFVGMIDERAFERVSGYLAEAREAGARVEPLSAEGLEPASNRRKIPPAVIVDPEGDLAISREEIFGPLMVLRPYRDLAQVVDWLDRGERPLGLYYFGGNRRMQKLLRDRTISGGMTVNDVVSHASLEEAPLGGVGNSGMGAYHGRAGFDTFSHLKTTYYQGRLSLLGLLAPPYKPGHMKMLDRMLGR